MLLFQVSLVAVLVILLVWLVVWTHAAILSLLVTSAQRMETYLVRHIIVRT